MSDKRELIVPTQIVANTGEDQSVFEAIDRFFLDVETYLDLDDFSKQIGVNRESRSIGLEIAMHQPSADALTTLVINDVLAASVILRRNSWNWVEASFASYLDDKVVQTIKRRGIDFVTARKNNDDDPNRSENG